MNFHQQLHCEHILLKKHNSERLTQTFPENVLKAHQRLQGIGLRTIGLKHPEKLKPARFHICPH